MSTSLVINLIVWGVILVVTIILWLYRRMLENREDHYIHLHADEHDTKVLQQQTTVGKKVNAISKSTRILIVVLVVYGLAIAAFEVYRAWNNTGTT